MKRLWIILTGLVFFVASCEKEEVLTIQDEIQFNNDNNISIAESGKHFGKISDKNIDNLHKEVSRFAEVLKEMYSSEVIRSEVNGLIYSGYYSDENVLLSDLIKPEESKMHRNTRSADFVFKKEFYSKLQSRNARGTDNKFDEYLIKNGVSIYFPYSENFKDNSRKDITIVMPPKNDTNEATGIKLEKCGDKICETKVLVNDAYAIKNPTHIIYAGGAKVKEQYVKDLKNARSTSSINQVYVGAVRCNKQYDSFISFTGNGGGSELKFFRGSGYLSSGTNGQITSPTGDIISCDFSRSQINNCNVQVINASWDIDWKTDNLEQVFGVYEEDNQGTKVFTGSINTTVKVNGQNVNGTLGYNITVQTQDEIIRNWKIGRSAFYTANPISQGYGTFTTVGGLTGGPWAAWDGAVSIGNCTGANVAYVLPTITN